MQADINLILLDRFRQVGRLLRMGWTPSDYTAADRTKKGRYREESEKNHVHLFKRETILTVLLLSPDGMNQREIADEMCVSPSTISEMINHLVEDGYADRRENPKDRRTKVLGLTPEGKVLAEEILEERFCVLRHLFRHLSDSEKQDLVQLIEKLLGQE